MVTAGLRVNVAPDPVAPAPRVLGIDPGLLRTGYAVLDRDARSEARLVEAGVIRLASREPLARRLAALAEALELLIETHRPPLLVCEDLYAHYAHPRTAILMGHARGVVLVTAARRGLEVLSVGATRVKKTLTGSGHASKAQIQRAVAGTLRLARLPEPSDVADAIAIGLCGLRLPRSGPGASAPGRRRVMRAADGLQGAAR
ncbi:MAG: crossover junction endodeoxyribonuclease RuvC [Planctomycetia bacterium]|nr:MAG: crossover junction endodeoxyribonuclease RuvC [Planctomycetia bacterium]